MADMGFSYTPYGGTAQNLLDANTRMLSFDGFGLPRRQPESTRMPLMDGVHHLDDEIYTPERYMHLVLLVEGTDYSNWKANDDALLAKLIGIQETNELGYLYVTKPDGTQRMIRCALTEYPNDHDLNYSPWASKRVLTFYAPDPHFQAVTFSQTSLSKALVDMTISGYLYPAVFPWGGYAEMGCVRVTITNGGNARCFPRFWVSGPCANPLFYNATTEEWLQIPVTIPAYQYVVVYFDTAEWLIAPTGTPTDWQSDFILGSTLWQLQVGANDLLVAAEGLDPTQVHIEYHYNKYKAL